MTITRTEPFTVGILSRRTPVDPDRLFGSPTTFFSECCLAAEHLGLRAVVFEAEDLDPHSDIVRAAAFSDGQWCERKPVPFPDVVYDRAPVCDPAYTPSANQARYRLIDVGVPFVNPVELLQLAADKMATCRCLARYGVRLPATSLVDSGTLADYLDRFDHLFLKPVHGSNGIGIIEIQRTVHTGYILRYETGRYRLQTVRQIEQTVKDLTGNPGSQEGVYLVQQGISMQPPGERRFPRFDLRIIMQKDEHRVWGMTGIVARVSQSDVPTTNLSTGARAEVVEPVLDALYGPVTRQASLASITSMCSSICHNLDRDVCLFGELGIDIVTDADGQPWVIEINAKPGRSVFKRIAYSEDVSEEERQRFLHIRRQSVAMPFRYARILMPSAALC